MPSRRAQPALAALAALVFLVVAAVAPAGARTPKLRWKPPKLASPLVVKATAAHNRLTLDPARDYVVRLPRRPLRVPGGIWIVGGHHVVVRGGDVVVPPTGGGPDQAYGIFAKSQTGTLHVEGVRLRGRGLGVGIALDQGAGATVQVQNTRVEVRRPIPADDTIHPDVMQTWRGPFALRVDRLTGMTTDKGLNLQPHEYDVQPLSTWHLRHVDISGGRYALWKNDWSLQTGGPVGFWRMRQHDVFVKPGRRWGVAYPNRKAWRPVRIGRPRGGHFVSRRVAGARYRSPGYRR